MVFIEVEGNVQKHTFMVLGNLMGNLMGNLDTTKNIKLMHPVITKYFTYKHKKRGETYPLIH